MEYRAEAVFLGLGVFEVGLREVWVLGGGGDRIWDLGFGIWEFLYTGLILGASRSALS